MQRHYLTKSPEDNPTFAKICRLAREQDSEGILGILQLQQSTVDIAFNFVLHKHAKEFVVSKTHGSIDIRYGIFNPLRWLAYNGESDAVSWLLEHFDCYFRYPLHDVIFGYAQGGLPEGFYLFKKNFANKSYKGQEELIRSYVAGCVAGGHPIPPLGTEIETCLFYLIGIIRGNAIKENFDEMHQIIRPGVFKCILEGITSCAMLGFFDEAKKMLGLVPINSEEYHVLNRSFFSALAQGGHDELVSSWLSQYDHSQRKREIEYALQGYLMGGHIQQAIQLVALEGVLIPDLYSFLFEGMTVFDNTGLFFLDYVEETGLKLKKIMSEYALNFHQAQALLTKGARAWLMQGAQLTKNDSQPYLVHDLFILISSYVTALSSADMMIVLLAVNKKLRDDLVAEYSTRAFSFFRSQKNIESYVSSVDGSYRKRIGLYRT